MAKIPPDACTRYVTGFESYASLAALYRCSVRAIKEHGREEGWPQQRKEYWLGVETDIRRRKREVVTRSLQIYEGMQAKALFSLDQAPVVTPSVAVKLLQDGIRGEETLLAKLADEVQVALRRAGVAEEDLPSPVVPIDLCGPPENPVDVVPPGAPSGSDAPALLPAAYSQEPLMSTQPLAPSNTSLQQTRADGRLSLRRLTLRL